MLRLSGYLFLSDAPQGNVDPNIRTLSQSIGSCEVVVSFFSPDMHPAPTVVSAPFLKEDHISPAPTGFISVDPYLPYP